MSLRIVIVGGVAAGASAAAKARRVSEQAQIDVFERGPYISFANCGLPYYVGGQIAERQSLLLQTPESFWKRFRVKVHVRHEVLSIDRARKSIQVKNLETQEIFNQTYDKLILATGAGAIVPPLPGIGAENIFTVKTVPDSDAIKTFLREASPKRAVVVGAGFIGLESVEALRNKGLDVTLVEMLPQVLPPLDAEMARFVSDHLIAQGVHLVLGDGIKAFSGGKRVAEVELSSGRRIPTDLVILSIGVRPELKLAQDAGLLIGGAGGISVNEYQETSDPDIYAAGDTVEVLHGVTQKKTRIPLAGPANKEGRVAGANAAGERLTFSGAVGTAIVESLGITAAKTGLSEKEAKTAGLAHYVSFTHSTDHASYYPGSELMHIKLVVEEGTGRLLGAQIVGEQGVDKRIDVLATALSARLKVVDLENLDLAYAPQFSSAKDPVIMAGFVAANVARHDFETIACSVLQERLKRHDDLQIVDVRTPAEHAEGALPQAKLIPVDELRERMTELNPEKETVVYCRIGLRGYLAARILQQAGFRKVLNLTGGMLSCPPPTAVSRNASGNGNLGATISVRDLESHLSHAGVQAIDVREPDEFAFEHIEGTQNFPLSQLPQRLATLEREKDLLVLCQTGMRTRQAVAILEQDGFSKVHAVEGGIAAWKSHHLPVKRSPGPIPIMRQVQIVAGSLALLGGAIPGARWVAVIVGAGLLFAGLSGTCMMANILGHMPWNRRTSTHEPKPEQCGPGQCR